MVVPLEGHGRILGAISFLSSNPGRCYTKTDLFLAEDLASRAALALENALVSTGRGLCSGLRERRHRESGKESSRCSLCDIGMPEEDGYSIGMPEEDGYSLIARLRAGAPEQGGQLPAIALMAFNTEGP